MATSKITCSVTQGALKQRFEIRRPYAVASRLHYRRNSPSTPGIVFAGKGCCIREIVRPSTGSAVGGAQCGPTPQRRAQDEDGNTVTMAHRLNRRMATISAVSKGWRSLEANSDERYIISLE